MATKNFSVSNAKKNVKNLVNSPLFWLHAYNKACKKQTAIEGINVDELTKMFAAANKVTNNKGFTFDVLPQNSKGEICKLVAFTPKSYKGGEIIVNFVGTFEMQPISTKSFKTSLIDAISSYLEYRITAANDLQKTFGASAVNENGVIVPTKKKTRFEIAKMYADGLITEYQFNELLKNAA